MQKRDSVTRRHCPYISKRRSCPLDKSQYLLTSLSLPPAAFFRRPCVCVEVKAGWEREPQRGKSTLIFPSVLIDLAAHYWLSLSLSLLERKHSVTLYEWCSSSRKAKQCQTCRVLIIQRCVKLVLCRVFWRNHKAPCLRSYSQCSEHSESVLQMSHLESHREIKTHRFGRTVSGWSVNFIF